jgi:hypothetical protein
MPPRASSSIPACARPGAARELYDFLVQSATWKPGPVAISVVGKQCDKTYVAALFDNGRPMTLNFILTTGRKTG